MSTRKHPWDNKPKSDTTQWELELEYPDQDHSKAHNFRTSLRSRTVCFIDGSRLQTSKNSIVTQLAVDQTEEDDSPMTLRISPILF
jgi:hypothetical protein